MPKKKKKKNGKLKSNGNVGGKADVHLNNKGGSCLLYTSPSPRDATLSRMPSSA